MFDTSNKGIDYVTPISECLGTDCYTLDCKVATIVEPTIHFKDTNHSGEKYYITFGVDVMLIINAGNGGHNHPAVVYEVTVGGVPVDTARVSTSIRVPKDTEVYIKT